MFQIDRQFLKLLLATSLTTLGTTAYRSDAFAQSTWNAALGGSWTDATKWAGPVPNAPGDVAILARLPGVAQGITLSSGITLGQLTIDGPSIFTLLGTGPLTFSQPGAEAARLQVGGTARTHVIHVPINVVSGEDLVVDVIGGAVLSQRGAVSGDGVLTKRGAGLLEFTVGNPGWNGQLVVDNGEVSVDHATGLGASTGVAANGTRVNADGVLRLKGLIDPVNELFQLDGGTIIDRGVAATGNRFGRIELLSTSTIRNASSESYGSTALTGEISGAGGLILDGNFNITGNNTYAGETVIESGGHYVMLNSATGLGDAAAGTTIKANGELQLNVAAAEPLDVRGGRVVWRNNSQGWTGAAKINEGTLVLAAAQTFAFPIELAGNGTLAFNNANATWAGNATGAGSLRISGNGTVTGNLAHQGDLVLAGAKLESANSYTGATTIVQTTTVVNHSGAFGSSTTPIVIEGTNAKLELNQTVDRDLLVKGGTVEMRGGTHSYANVVRMERGRLQWEGLPFNGTVSLENAASPGEVVLSGGTLNGRITGGGKLALGGNSGPMIINSDNDYRGHTVVYNAELNSATALGSVEEGSLLVGGATIVRVATDEPLLVSNGARLFLDAQLGRLPQIYDYGYETSIEVRTASTYAQHVEPRLGTLKIAAPTTFGKVSMYGDATLRVESPGTLNLLDDEIVMQGGTIDGTINGLNSIKKVGPGTATVRRLHNFQGNIDVAQGTLNVTELWAGATTPAQASPNRAVINVTSPRGAMLHGGGQFVDADVHLNNARGIDNGGALDSMVLLGDLYLGDQGAYVSGRGGVCLRGAVYGGDLIFPDDEVTSEILITNNRAAYTGETLIRGGYLHLADGGKLTHTSQITIGADGMLLLNNSRSELGGGLPANENDRVADHIPVVMRGGEIRLWSPSEGTATERIGSLSVERGTATIFGNRSNYSPYDGVTILTLGEVEREVGATLFFDFEHQAGARFDAAPTLTNGIIGPWATVNRIYQGRAVTDFATYGPDGIQALTTFQQNLSAAGANDNVLLTQNTTLPAGTSTVNSLTMRGEDQAITLDLGGRRLAVASGGILIGGTIANGELAPGPDTNELIITRTSNRLASTINANIVDGAAGPTDVTLATSTHGVRYELGGANTYTGTMRVNSRVDANFTSFDALPTGSDLEVNGGTAYIAYQSSDVKSLGELTVRDGGRFGLQYPANSKVDFERINLETGSIRDVALVGDAAIIKTGDGTATLSPDGREFAGTVDVYDGTLIVEGSRAIGGQSVNVHGGSLLLRSIRNDPNIASGDVYLNGGDLLLDNEYKGKVFVNEPARIVGVNFDSYSRRALPGKLVGSAPVTFADRIDLVIANNEYSGDVAVEGHLVLRHSDGFGSGDVTVQTGGILELGFADGGSFSNDVTLAGGEITTAPETSNVPYPGKALGKITVTDDSFLTTNFRDDLEIAGPLELRDGVRLSKRDAGLLKVTGDLLVNGDVEFNLAPGFIRLRQNDGTTMRDVISEVQISGVIKAAADQASINFTRSGFDDLKLTASVHVDAGQSLSIQEDGVPIVYNLAPGATISGNGTFGNPVNIDGGVIAPGQSPGTLTFANGLTIGGGTTFEWEINNALGAAGAANGWDFIDVSQQLTLAATSANPLVIAVQGLNALNQPGLIPNFDPFQTYAWQIASADSIVGFDAAAVDFTFAGSSAPSWALRSENFSLRATADGLFVDYEFVIPEPSSAALALLSLAACGALRRRS